MRPARLAAIHQPALGERPPRMLRAIRHLAAVGCFLLAAAIAWTYLEPTVAENRATWEQEIDLIARRDALKAETARERARLQWLQYDPRYLEIHARDRLDLQLPGETIVRIRHSQQ